VATVVGKETVAWTEFVGGTTVPGSEKHKFLELQVRPLPHDAWHRTTLITLSMPQLVLCEEERSYAPGDHSFPFEFQLMDDAPSSFHLHDRTAHPLESIIASSTYTIKAATSVNGARFLEDVAAKLDFDVTLPYSGPGVQGLESSVTGKVGTLALFSKGTCNVAGSLDRDVFTAGETLEVHSSITNQSPKDMSAISLRLYEDLTVSLPNRKPRTGSKVVCRQDYLGVKAGQLSKQVLTLPLLSSANREPINATTATGAYINWHYRLVIKCKYALSHSVRLEFPITVLRAPIAVAVAKESSEPVAEPLAVDAGKSHA
jgi:hypothetical protein